MNIIHCILCTRLLNLLNDLECSTCLITANKSEYLAEENRYFAKGTTCYRCNTLKEKKISTCKITRIQNAKCLALHAVKKNGQKYTIYVTAHCRLCNSLKVL